MTDPTRGARPRRGPRRPGWILMTALLVLAIGASSALVFTNRVELLKLAVLLALWAAVVAAFVSVIYRRQSDSDQAKARDLKLVYDLQLDREISARREYELAVETQLRRELAAELRAQSSGEVSALRAELAALRANLEYLFDTDLSHRPAIETDRTTARVLGEWTPGADAPAGRVSVSRIDAENAGKALDGGSHTTDTEESPIIDVPAEPHPPEVEPVASVDEAGGAHRRLSEQARGHAHRADESAGRRREPPPPPPPAPPAPPPPAPKPESAPPDAHPEPLYPWLPPQRPGAQPIDPGPAAPAAAHWQPAPAEGQWIPSGAPGSHWAPTSEDDGVRDDGIRDDGIRDEGVRDDGIRDEGVRDDGVQDEYVGRRRAPDALPPEPSGAPPAAGPAHGRHYGAPGEGRQAAPRHRDAGDLPASAAAPSAAEQDGPEHAEGGAHTGGPSVAELMARLQATQSGGGRRRRRED
ncbi:MAG: hypothetical protein K0U70_01430 [Actinomycetia bacterium]|nr:hypothetical protein [Actinomycetes bacterium]